MIREPLVNWQKIDFVPLLVFLSWLTLGKSMSPHKKKDTAVIRTYIYVFILFLSFIDTDIVIIIIRRCRIHLTYHYFRLYLLSLLYLTQPILISLSFMLLFGKGGFYCYLIDTPFTVGRFEGALLWCSSQIKLQ